MTYNPQFYQQEAQPDVVFAEVWERYTTPSPDTSFEWCIMASRRTGFVQPVTGRDGPVKLGQESRFYKSPVVVSSERLDAINTGSTPQTILFNEDARMEMRMIVYAPDFRQPWEPGFAHDIWGYF